MATAAARRGDGRSPARSGCHTGLARSTACRLGGEGAEVTVGGGDSSRAPQAEQAPCSRRQSAWCGAPQAGQSPADDLVLAEGAAGPLPRRDPDLAHAPGGGPTSGFQGKTSMRALLPAAGERRARSRTSSRLRARWTWARRFSPRIPEETSEPSFCAAAR
jgi:hypothetical protein